MSGRDPTRAARQREHRWRRRTGKQAITVYCDLDIVEDAIHAGLIPPERAGDKVFIAKVLGRILENAVEA